jgi:hypothetical protein
MDAGVNSEQPHVSFSWQTNDLKVSVAGAKPFRLFSEISRECTKAFASEPSVTECEFQHQYRLLSIVGSMVSYQQESGTVCGTSTEWWGFNTIDVLNPGRYECLDEDQRIPDSKDVNLSELFGEQNVFNGLIASPEISVEIDKAISDGRLLKPPSNLNELSAFLNEPDRSKFNGDYYLSADYLSHFAFHRVENDYAILWLSLRDASRANGIDREHIEIKLLIPKKLQTTLVRASEQKSGFLMQNISTEGGSYARFICRRGRGCRREK